MNANESKGSVRETRKRGGKRLMICSIAAGALLAAGGTYAWLRPPAVPAPTAAPATLVKFVATPAFAQLPEEQKEPYLRSIQQNLHAVIAAGEGGALSKEEQVAAVRNVIRGRARLEARTYGAIADPKLRKAHLDRLIEEQEVLRRHDKEGRASPSMAQMKTFMEALPPEERIQVAGLAFDLVKRRAERGLSALPIPGMK